MLSFAEGLFNALLALFFFGLPTLFVLMMVGGLSNARIEAWEMPDAAMRMKRMYHLGARWGLHGVRGLLGLFLVRIMALMVLRDANCEVHASHVSAAAFNLVGGTDVLFGILYAAIAALAVAGFIWAIAYFAKAKAESWADPRRKDGVVVHVLLVPLSLLLIWVAFGITSRMLCPFLVGA